MAEALNEDEDDDLRCLHFLSMLGMLPGRAQPRLAELRARDGRTRVPPPRGLEYVLVERGFGVEVRKA